MIKLINETADMHMQYTAVRNIEMTLDDEANLEEMLDAFKRFLQASGYTIDGYLDIIQEDEYNGSNEEGRGRIEDSPFYSDESLIFPADGADEAKRDLDDHDGGMLGSGC